MTEGTRLNKYLASCAAGSRRGCDELIQAGRVEINGSVCTNLATRVGPEDHVKVDGKRMTPRGMLVVVFHKPRGLVCTREDELGRATIYDLLPKTLANLHHVGRLDLDSEGLLILTNDGELSQRLMHPSKAVEKEYLVTANQAFEDVHLDQFLAGIYTAEGGKLRAKTVERLSSRRIKIVLEHGAKRQIRVMFEAMGYQVSKLLRVRIGQLWLGDLEPGGWAVLSPAEVAMLLAKPAAQAKGKQRGIEDVKKPVGPERPAAKGVKKWGAKGVTTGGGRPKAGGMAGASRRERSADPPPSAKRRGLRGGESRHVGSEAPRRKSAPPGAPGRGPKGRGTPPPKPGPPQRRGR
jgi:23S rRNA pseudouridine2605 synthase